MSWRMDSTAGATIWDSQPMSADDLALRDEEIMWLMQKGRQEWKLINGRIAKKGDPVANVGAYSSLAAYPPAATLANVASINGEGALWTTSLYSPWLANALTAPSAWDIYVAFQTTTSTSPASVTFNPRIGSIAAGSSSTGAVALGAGSSIAYTASITASDWIYEGRITVQSIGAPGANSKANGAFKLWAKPVTAGTGIATIFDISGYTQASFDSSVTSGFVLGLAETVTTITHAPIQIIWTSI